MAATTSSTPTPTPAKKRRRGRPRQRPIDATSTAEERVLIYIPANQYARLIELAEMSGKSFTKYVTDILGQEILKTLGR